MTDETGPPPPVPAHWLRTNHREWTPPQVIFFDTETRAAVSDDGELHTLRLWSARLVVRRARRAVQVGTVDNWGKTGPSLAAQIDRWCAGQTVMWVYCHNLAFDLTTTHLIGELERLGWSVTEHAVASDTPWLRMKRGRCVVTLADSWGWLRGPLHEVAAAMGMTKPELPRWDDSDAAWRRRCEADTDVLATAMLQILNWWDTSGLGSWALTGSAAGWNVMRHMMPERSIMIVTDAAQVEADRAAIYGGRRQAFRHGVQPGGPFHLLDFHRAYTVVCRDYPLPVRRRGNFESLAIDSPVICGDRYGVIAECEVETDTPRWPVRAGGRVAYPVGRFRTVLAGPEIAEARRLGHLRSIGAGYLHELGTPMAAWAAWCIDQQSAPDSEVPPAAKLWLKHVGRAVPGKTAAHGWDKTDAGPAQHDGWWYEPTYDLERQLPGHLVELGGRAIQVVQTAVGDNAYPAILAYVEAWTRVHLGRVIDAIGADNVVSCDTDGLIIRGDFLWRDRIGAEQTGPLELRHKKTWQELQVWGPQHYRTETERKLSGIPKSAKPNKDGKLQAVLWPKLPWQMAQERADGYFRPLQTYSVAESYITGWVMPDGSVTPPTAIICPCGTTVITHWSDGPDGAAVMEPCEVQAAHLASIITAATIQEGPCSYHSCKSSGTVTELSQSPPMASSTYARNRAIRVAARVYYWLRPGSRGVRAVQAESSP